MNIFAQDLSWPYWLVVLAVYVGLDILCLVKVLQATRDRVRRWQAVAGLWLVWGGVLYFSLGGWPLHVLPADVVGLILTILAAAVTTWVLSRIKDS